MRLFVVALLLVTLWVVPTGVALAEPFCDYALYSGKVIDWLVCGLFAWIIRAGEYNEFGNEMVYW